MLTNTGGSTDMDTIIPILLIAAVISLLVNITVRMVIATRQRKRHDSWQQVVASAIDLDADR